MLPNWSGRSPKTSFAKRPNLLRSCVLPPPVASGTVRLLRSGVLVSLGTRQQRFKC